MKVRLRAECIWRMLAVLMTLSLAAIVFAGCESKEPLEEVKIVLNVSSSAFKEGSRIPINYSCQGEDISPELQWDEPPAGTQSFALIMDDPDALGGIFTHWVLFNIPLATRQLPEAVPTTAQLTDGSLQGKNDFGRIGYGGPCPPRGPVHRYRFTLYALDKLLELKPGASKKQLIDVMKGHILAQGQLMGTYQR